MGKYGMIDSHTDQSMDICTHRPNIVHRTYSVVTGGGTGRNRFLISQTGELLTL